MHRLEPAMQALHAIQLYEAPCQTGTVCWLQQAQFWLTLEPVCRASLVGSHMHHAPHTGPLGHGHCLQHWVQPVCCLLCKLGAGIVCTAHSMEGSACGVCYMQCLTGLSLHTGSGEAWSDLQIDPETLTLPMGPDKFDTPDLDALYLCFTIYKGTIIFVKFCGYKKVQNDCLNQFKNLSRCRMSAWLVSCPPCGHSSKSWSLTRDLLLFDTLEGQ